MALTFTCFWQKEVEAAIQEKKRKDELEREESMRIARMYPITWSFEHDPSAESTDSISSNHAFNETNDDILVRTPSPTGQFESYPESNVSQVQEKISKANNPGPQIRKTIHKTPQLFCIKEAPEKVGPANCFKSLRSELTPAHLTDFELSSPALKSACPFEKASQHCL